MTNHSGALRWVEEMAGMCQPDNVVWCTGSEQEKADLEKQAVAGGEIYPLNQDILPGCYLHRTAVNDVARTEHLTFICTPTKKEAGITNNWMDPAEAYAKVGELFQGCMKGRTMYVMPFLMGPPGSEFTKIGIQITDSIYVVLNMRIMTRMGDAALEELGTDGEFTRCLHSKGELDPERRYIMHFPQDNTIWSYGSGYGGNALLGKKCLSLRIASYLGRKEGWMAEHMLVVGIQSPDGEVRYVAGAFPSACGKTNLAMLIPPESMPGYKVWTVGDDIAWLRVGPDGRLWAVNPEAGFFGVLPGTNRKTNPNAMETMSRNSIYTNVVQTPDGNVWWEGKDEPPPAEGIDWKGQKWTPDSGEVGAHPNGRFTAPASQCPVMSDHWQDPQGVPISAILFGGRRARVAPLIFETRDWEHGTFVGATMASETTSAAASASGVLRRDPMAMLPFCGYNMADYLRYWLEIGSSIPSPPRIFHVNWFRRDEQGKFLWPGFGQNLRAVDWALRRCKGEADGVDTPIGFVPTEESLNLEGLNLTPDQVADLLSVDREVWQEEAASIEEYFAKFGDELPAELLTQLETLKTRLG